MNRITSRKNLVTFAALAAFALVALPGHAQTFNVIYYFGGGGDGAYPISGLTIDRSGKLYGATFDGGVRNCQGDGCGVVFNMTLRGSTWGLAPLYDFTNGSDGAQPYGPVAIGPSGELYGIGVAPGDGMLYELRPSATRPVSAAPRWNESVIYSFDGSDGARPQGPLAVDTAGNLYGATYGGEDNGTVFQLTRHGGIWTQSTLYAFQGGLDGGKPMYGVAIDLSGNLFGTTSVGGAHGCGTVFEISPSGSGWIENTIYEFTGGDGACNPSSGLTMDAAGNLYGNTDAGATGGITYRLTNQNGTWNVSVLHVFPPYDGPNGSLALDSSGNVYGTSRSVFKLQNTNGIWAFTSLHDFSCGLDGCAPLGVSIDAQGNLFGMTQSGGITNSFCDIGCGVVWEITQ